MSEASNPPTNGQRVMRYYLADESADHRPAPYPVQFALEAMARQ